MATLAPVVLLESTKCILTLVPMVVLRVLHIFTFINEVGPNELVLLLLSPMLDPLPLRPDLLDVAAAVLGAVVFLGRDVMTVLITTVVVSRTISTLCATPNFLIAKIV